MINEVRAIIHETFAAELAGLPIDDSLNLFTNGIIDSFALVNLVSALEQHYDIRIPDSDAMAANLGSADLVTAYLTKRLV